MKRNVVGIERAIDYRRHSIISNFDVRRKLRIGPHFVPTLAALLYLYVPVTFRTDIDALMRTLFKLIQL